MPLDQSEITERVVLLAPSIGCAACIGPIEATLMAEAGVLTARVNLTTRRIAIQFDPQRTTANQLIDALEQTGVSARLISTEEPDTTDQTGRDLLLRTGVAGFAAMNVMLLSISVWSGAEGAVRDLLHWVSALIALPAIAFSGLPFFRSATNALRHGRMNMDVPIALAIALSAASSLFETSTGGEHAFFDAGIMLIFFLLVGRYLEHRMRARARSAAAQLLEMTGRYAVEIGPDGARSRIAVNEIRAGMTLSIPAGARIPADGWIIGGQTDLDRSLITGESDPVPAVAGDEVLAGVLNLTGSVTVHVARIADDTHLAEISRMVEAAEGARNRFTRIADSAARIYAPAVHALAAMAFGGWLWASGDLALSIQIAAAVLIITCPCALALAIPTVQMAAGAWLFRHGIFLKSGDALERLAGIDTVVLDKTGTVTSATPELITAPDQSDTAWPVAYALAQASSHPYAQAIACKARETGIAPAGVSQITEHPGLGVSGILCDGTARLGRPEWLGLDCDASTALELPDGTHRLFNVRQQLRPDAAKVCRSLQDNGLSIALLSGDRASTTQKVAAEIGVKRFASDLSPQDKYAELTRLSDEGHKSLMVGDGLNDTPALARADVSMAPGEATDITRNMADIVFTGERLAPVAAAWRIARTARLRGNQCIAIALAYNLIAVPIAVMGYVTPLIAAAAMSASSLIVVLNALRMGDKP